METDTVRALVLVVFAVLVASSLFSRRLPMGKTAKIAGAWLAIFAGLFLIFAFRAELGSVWQRVKGEFLPGTVIEAEGELRLRKAEMGHFFVDAKMNGQSVRLMVDSGASSTTISRDAALRVGAEIDDKGFPVVVQTANGITEVQRARIRRLEIGSILRVDVPIHVTDGLGEDDGLLGMSWLSTVKSWRIEGDEMVIIP